MVTALRTAAETALAVPATAAATKAACMDAADTLLWTTLMVQLPIVAGPFARATPATADDAEYEADDVDDRLL